MAAVPVTLVGMTYASAGGAPPKMPVETTFVGLAFLSDVGPGGGPAVPLPGQPPGMWGPNDPRPTPPIYVPGQPPGMWGPGDPRPTPPIAPGGPPPEIPEGSPDDDGFIKAPPPTGGWCYHVEYGWLYSPPGGGGKPQPRPPGGNEPQPKPARR